MSIVDDIAKITAGLDDAIAALRQIRRKLALEADLAAPAAASVTEPKWGAASIPADVWTVIETSASSVGLHAATLAAIEVWETAWFTSKLFKQGWNPGGIKYRPDVSALRHVLPPYEATDGNKYATYATWQEGIQRHAEFFRQPRYAVALGAGSAEAEVAAIHEAGYAEHSPEWLAGVTDLVQRFEKERPQ